MQNIPTVEGRILEGFQKRYYQQFGSDIVIAQRTDQVLQLQMRANGKKLEYPFAYAKVNVMASPESDHYASRYLTRRGLTVTLGNESNTAYNVRLLPAHFELEVTYETNSVQKVTWYIKRWLFSARSGHLKFTIPMGNFDLRIGIVMDLSITVPSDKAAPSEEETGYKVVSNCTIKGYMSEATAKKVGGDTKMMLDAYMANEHFWHYPDED